MERYIVLFLLAITSGIVVKKLVAAIRRIAKIEREPMVVRNIRTGKEITLPANYTREAVRDLLKLLDD